MSFDLEDSQRRARARFDATGAAGGRRKPRSDAGKLRMDPRALAVLQASFSRSAKPRMREVLGALEVASRRQRFVCPSRATVYNALPRLEAPRYRIAELPDYARATLFNLDARGEVPGHQLAFHLLNHGDTRALSFAAALPWLCLYQAERMPGFRPKSLALLRALLDARSGP